MAERVPQHAAVHPAVILTLLRTAVGSPPLAPLPDEHAASLGQPLHDTLAIDSGAWVAWCLAGLQACAVPPETTSAQERPDPWAPPIRVMVNAARGAAVAIAMLRHDGNLTRAAKSLGTSRRALREALKQAGLYPWGGAPAIDTTSTATPAVDTTSTATVANAGEQGGQA